MSKTNDDEIIKLLSEGKSQREIARHFDCSDAAVSKKIKRLKASEPLDSFKLLTDKEKKFALAIAEGKTKTDAAMVSHDCVDRKSGKVVGCNLAKKESVSLAISEIMDMQGLSRTYKIKRLKHWVDSKDPLASLKSLDMAFRLRGEYKDQQNISIGFNLIQIQESVDQNIEDKVKNNAVVDIAVESKEEN